MTRRVGRHSAPGLRRRTGGIVLLVAVLGARAAQGQPAAGASTQPARAAIPVATDGGVSIQILPNRAAHLDATAPTSTARFSPALLTSLLTQRSAQLPLSMQLDGERQAYEDTLARIAMGSVVEALMPYLIATFAERFDPQRDLIRVPVPADRQVELPMPEGVPGPYRGPKVETIGFLLHDITDDEFLRVAVRAMHVARQQLETGDARHDRTSARFYALLAAAEMEVLHAAQKRLTMASKAREMARRRIGAALGLTYDAETKQFSGKAAWAKETRQFKHVVKDGKFIARIDTLVEQHNHDLEQAGFVPPASMGTPGIHYDADLQEVDLVLPKAVLEDLLSELVAIERRMAENDIISIEAVRLTDMDLTTGAIASRLNATVRGVHDVVRRDNRNALREFSLNSLLAVANSQIQISNLRDIENGLLPAGSPALALPGLTLPGLEMGRTATTVGSQFSVGADDIFFDGREQTYGFSYIGPDGLEHTIGLDVVDSLRDFWDRIERNLIVHKIRRSDETVDYTVPIGPAAKTVKGIAALIAQRDETIVVATQQTLTELKATAGTWLVIQDFEITPLPGASTTLTSEELRELEQRVQMTMFLRDPQVPPEKKTELVEARTQEDLGVLLTEMYASVENDPIRPGIGVPTYQQVFDRRRGVARLDAAVEKRERNSKIKLSFYSSQGDILSQPGTTQLGSSNELTSFTTEVRPNVVTPISSFLTKSASGAKGSSPLTGVSKGEQTSEEKNMTHLVLRVRFPTVARERADLQEGRFLGYFDLPLGRTPHSQVDLPFLSSSEHPLERLSKLRVGLMFPSLQREKVRKPFQLINPNQLQGTVSPDVWETATTRMLMNRKVISDSLHGDQALAAEYGQRFVVEVRTLLEYDEDFFDLPNVAMRNTIQWNNPERILVALNNSTGKFALERLVQMIDDLGARLVTDEYAARYVGVSHQSFWGRHKVRPLTAAELIVLRRDVGSHFLRLNETYGDAFLEAVSELFDLGSYANVGLKAMLQGPFRGYRDLVVFDAAEGQVANRQRFEAAHEEFTILLRGGYKGGFGKRSLTCIEDMEEPNQHYVACGREILQRDDWWRFFYP